MSVACSKGGMKGACVLLVLAMCLFANPSAMAAATPAIQKYLAPNQTVAASSKAELSGAVRQLMAEDPKNAPLNISEAVKSVATDRERIDTILSTAVRYLKNESADGVWTAVSDGKSTAKEVKEPASITEFDCAVVLEIWSLSLQAAPAMDQWIIEIGMREAPECFIGTLSETVTETGSILRRFNTNLGLRGATNPSNTASNPNRENPDDSSPRVPEGDVSPSIEQ